MTAPHRTAYQNWLPYAALSLATLSSAAQAQDASTPREVRVATREAPPFAMRNESGEWTGISIELMEQLRADLAPGTTLRYEEMTLAEMLDAVADGEVDLAAAALTVNYEREQRLDFSHPYFSGGLGIAVPLEEGAQGVWGLARAVLSPGFLNIVAGLLVTMLAVGVAVYVFERRVNREQFGGGALRGILSGLWWSAVTLTTVGYGDKVPKSTGGRIIGAVWMFSGLFIIASFTAAITSALTLSSLQSRVSGPNDLPRVRVATVRDSTSADYLAGRRIFARGYPDVAEALASLAEGRCDAVVYDSAVLRYQVQQEHADDLIVLPTEFARQDYALALPHGSDLRETVNQSLLRITSTPEWESRLKSLLGTRD